MRGNKTAELIVGLFVLAGIACLAYLSIQTARTRWLGTEGLRLRAFFSTAGGLKEGAGVEIAGVRIGQVESLTLDEYRAKTVLRIREDIEIRKDAIARIKTKGLLGEKYIDLSPGASDTVLQENDRIRDTQAPVDFEELISKLVFSKL